MVTCRICTLGGWHGPPKVHHLFGSEGLRHGFPFQSHVHCCEAIWADCSLRFRRHHCRDPRHLERTCPSVRSRHLQESARAFRTSKFPSIFAWNVSQFSNQGWCPRLHVFGRRTLFHLCPVERTSLEERSYLRVGGLQVCVSALDTGPELSGGGIFRQAGYSHEKPFSSHIPSDISVVLGNRTSCSDKCIYPCRLWARLRKGTSSRFGIAHT